MDTSGRLLRLLSLLQARGGWTGPELADRCGVTNRTLRRDVNRLRDLGYAIIGEPGPMGGYRLGAGGALPPLLLDDAEAVTVALALRGAADGGMPGMEDAAVVALAKIEHVLPNRLKTRLGELTETTVRLPASPSATRLDVSALVTVAQVCRGPERLRFSYRDAKGEVTEPHVEPFRLVNVIRRWYLVARDRDREAWRSFRIDRMTAPTPTGVRFDHQDPPDPLRFVTEGMAVGGYRYQTQVLLETSLDEATRMVSPTVGVLQAAGERVRLVMGADDLEWIARYLASIPCRFTVIQPPELTEEVAALAGRLAEDSSPLSP